MPCCCGVHDCISCDDLPPANPSGPPVHINIVRSLSGTCGTGTVGGSQTYNHNLSFGPEGPISGHEFCAHNIFDGSAWTGAFTCNGVPFYTQGFTGLLGRDQADCTWWFDLDPFLPTNCGGGGCNFTGTTIFQMIAGPGDPSGVYTFTETFVGFTMITVVTIS